MENLTFFHAWGIRPGGIAGSYGLNGYMLRIEDDEHDSLVPKEEGWRKFLQIVQPNNVPTLVDALHPQLWPMPDHKAAENEADAWFPSASNGEGYPAMRKACIDRHAAFVNVAFVDSSVRKVGLKELWTLRWHQGFNTAGPMTIAGGG